MHLSVCKSLIRAGEISLLLFCFILYILAFENLIAVALTFNDMHLYGFNSSF